MPWWAYPIAIFELLGGLAGIGIWVGSVDEIFVYMPAHPVTGVVSWLLGMIILFLFAGSVVAGSLLLGGRVRGWQLSRVVQGAQVLQFHLLGVKLAFVSGAAVVAGIDRELIFTLNSKLGSWFDLWLGKEPDIAFVGLNGIAAVLFALLLSPPKLEGTSNDIRKLAG